MCLQHYRCNVCGLPQQQPRPLRWEAASPRGASVLRILLVCPECLEDLRAGVPWDVLLEELRPWYGRPQPPARLHLPLGREAFRAKALARAEGSV